MLELIIFYLAMLCTNPAPHVPGPMCNGIHIMMEKDGGDETGDIPPPPLPPPPPHP